MDEEMTHICKDCVAGIGPMSREKLVNLGVRTVRDLMLVRTRSQAGELDSVRREVREALVMAAEWITNNAEADILRDFDEDKYQEIYAVRKEQLKKENLGHWL
jgi:predicted RecB family nuclease